MKCEHCGIEADNLLLRTTKEEGRIKHIMICFQCLWLLKNQPENDRLPRKNA